VFDRVFSLYLNGRTPFLLKERSRDLCIGGEHLKITAIQLNAIFANVEANLVKVKEYVNQAAMNGSELVLFPEFFTSAIGFSPKMLAVAIQNHQVQGILQQLSSEYQVIIGGSYLMFDGHNAYNLFELVFPNGEVFAHKKDIPTQFENCYYTNGDENHVLNTPIGNIGVALCWEMIRYDTVKRLSGKVDIVLAGSCWWDIPMDARPEREPLRQYNQKLALETPVIFAKLLQVPVVHANHCGEIVAYNFPDHDKLQTRRLVGATQMIDADGKTIAKRQFHEGEGMIQSDISWNAATRKQVHVPQEYWIPDLPDSYTHAWETINPKGKKYYESVALPHYKARNSAF